MKPFSPRETDEIENIANKEFFRLTEFAISDLLIEIKPRYFFTSSEEDGAASYVATLSLKKSEQALEFNPMPFTVKTTSRDIAFHIAHQVWTKYDKDMKSQLWKNFDPKG